MGKGLNLTDTDLKELEEEKKRNSKQRMDFVDSFSKWLKKTPNKIWSKQQVKYLK